MHYFVMTINADQDADHQAASLACVIEEEVSDEAMSGKDVEAWLVVRHSDNMSQPLQLSLEEKVVSRSAKTARSINVLSIY